MSLGSEGDPLLTHGRIRTLRVERGDEPRDVRQHGRFGRLSRARIDAHPLPSRSSCPTAAPTLGEPVYERIDAEATPEEKAVLRRLSPATLGLTELAGEPLDAVLTTAPGDGQPIGGSKVITEDGWCAARPSGTDAVYKLYAKRFKGHDHLRRIQEVFRTKAAR